MNPELELLAYRIVSALFNGVYQGILVAAVVWVSFKLFRKMSATTRHAIGFVALLIVAILPVLHFVNSTPKAADEVESEALAEPPVATPTEVFALEPIFAPSVEDARAEQVFPSATSQETEQTLFAEDGNSLRVTHSGMTEVDVATQLPGADHSLASRLTPTSLAGEVPPAVSVAILGVILFVVLWRVVRLVFQFVCLVRLKRQGVLLNEETNAAFETILLEAGCRRQVRLASCEHVNTPIAIGYFDPVVMLPANLIASSAPGELDAVLRHEVAHIVRRDDWLNLVQQVVVAACFFNPAIWWLSQRITIDRELACDDHALSRSSSREEYALTLTEFAGRSQESRWIAAPAAWNTNSQLKERINMILDPNRNTSLKLGKASAGVLALVATGIAGVAFLTAPRLVLAEPQLELGAPATPTASGDIFGTPTVGSPKPPLNAASDEPAETSSSELVGPVISSSDVVTPDESRSQNRGRVRYGSSLNANSGSVSSDPVSLNTTAPEVAVHPSPRVVVVQATPTRQPAPVAPVKPRAPRYPVPPPVVHVQTLPGFETQHNISLERRMEALERKLAEMTAIQTLSRRGFAPPEPPDAPGDPFSAENHSAGQWSEQFGEQQQHDIEVAVEEASQELSDVTVEVEIANQRVDREIRGEVNHNAKMEMQARRNALVTQKRSLEKQMRELDRQMERLHDQVHAVEEQLHQVKVQEPRSTGREPVDAFGSF